MPTLYTLMAVPFILGGKYAEMSPAAKGVQPACARPNPTRTSATCQYVVVHAVAPVIRLHSSNMTANRYARLHRPATLGSTTPCKRTNSKNERIRLGHDPAALCLTATVKEMVNHGPERLSYSAKRERGHRV